MIPPANRGNTLRAVSPEVPARNYALPPASYMSSPYHAVHGVQYPLAYPGGMMSHRPLSGSPSAAGPVSLDGDSASSSVASPSSGGQVEGSHPNLLPFCFCLLFLMVLCRQFNSSSPLSLCRTTWC